MRTLVILAIVLLPACSTTSDGTVSASGDSDSWSTVERRLSRDGSRNMQARCGGGRVLVCNSDDRNARCDCVNRNVFRQNMPLPRDTRHSSF